MPTGTITIDFDTEVAALEQQAHELREARQNRRIQLQIRLQRLRSDLSALTTPPARPDANDDPRVKALHQAFTRAQATLRDHQRRRPYSGAIDPTRTSEELFRAALERFVAARRAHEDRERCLLADVYAAASRYEASVSARLAQITAAEEAAARQREIEAAECRAAIAGAEAELLRLGKG